MPNKRKVILYIAMSLDGFIAKENDDLSFLEIVAKEGEDYGYGEFINSVDTIIIGRKTYDWILTHVPEYLYSDKETFVITRTPKPKIGKTEFYSGNLKELVTRLKEDKGKTIFVDGGAEIVNEMLKDHLIDDFIISIIPIILGSGVRLFQNGFPEQELKLISSNSFEKGLVQLHYQRNA